MPTLNDWTLELQFDDSKVTKGLRDLEKKFNKLGNIKVTMDTKAAKRSMNQRMQQERAVGEEGRRQARRTANLQERLVSESALRTARQRVGRMQEQTRAVRSQASMQTSPQAKANFGEASRQLALMDKLQQEVAYGSQVTRARLTDLINKIDGVGSAAKRTATSQKMLNKEFRASEFAAGSLGRSVKNLASSYISVFAAISAASGLVRVGRDLEDTSATLLLASGSAEEAARDMAFVKKLSTEVKIPVADLTRSFAKFAVAGSTAGVSVDTIKQNFTDLSKAIRATGLTQDRANLAFLGFQQMLAGPVVQAQEMNQIVEQMPQFAGLAAKALKEMGFEAENYRDAIKTGTVDSQQFINVVSRLMREQAIKSGAYAKSLETVTASAGDLRNTLDAMVKSLFEAGLADTLRTIMSGLGTAIKAVTPALQVLVGAINLTIQTVALALHPFERLGALFGLEEGEGLVWAVRLLSAVLTYKLVTAMRLTILKSKEMLASALLTAKGFFGWAVGANSAAAATGRLAMAVRFLMRALGLGLAIEGLGLVFDFFTGQGLFNNASSKSNSGSTTTNTTNISGVDIKVDGATGEEAAQEIHRVLGQLSVDPSTVGG